ncbi:MAG: alpha/beta hydrolase [Thermoguttaceae bacterium]
MHKSTLSILAFVTVLITASQLSAQTRVEEAAKMKPTAQMNLWPGVAPGEKGDIAPEKSELGNEKPPIMRISDVSVPTLTFYKSEVAKAADKKAPCVVIFPGGGYGILAYDYEGIEVAHWLNSFGVDAVVCKYRVPRREGREKHAAPLQDAQRAIRLVRENAEKWGVDTNKIGVLGFSAGGHLTIMASTAYDEKTYEPVDEADKLSCRPDFALPIYPAYILGEDQKTWDKSDTDFSPEIKYTKDTPPMFLTITNDDFVGPMGAVKTYVKLHELGVPCELHVFVKGAHGYGLRHDNGRAAKWDELAESWLKTFIMQN